MNASPSLDPAASRSLRRSVVAATVVGALLRTGSLIANLDFAHGDVITDSAVTDSVAQGLGLWIPWEDGSALYPDPIGQTVESFGHPSDSHGPLWPLLGAPIARLFGDGYLALQILSWLAGIATIPIAARVFGRWNPRGGALAAWAIALSFLLSDYSGNGSLYAGQIAGSLALPLVAGSLDRPRNGLLAGAFLGVLYLISYACVLLIPAFAIAVFASRGIRGSIRPLLFAGVACLAVTAPWFIRNALVFGDPLFSTNPAFFLGRVGAVSHDVAGLRPMLVVATEPGAVLDGMLWWTPWNLGYTLALVHLFLPVFSLFAPSGFVRMLGFRRGGRLDFAGVYLLLTFVGCLFTAVICPTPKTRYFATLLPFLAGAGAVAIAARTTPVLTTIWTAITIGIFWWIDPANNWAIPYDAACWIGLTAAVPLLAFAPPIRRFVGPLAIVLVAAVSVVAIAVNQRVAWNRAIFPNPNFPEDRPRDPTFTFYDILPETEAEPMLRAELRELAEIGRILREREAKVIIGPVDFLPHSPGMLVTTRGQIDLPVLRRIARTFNANAIVLRTSSKVLKDDTELLHVYEWLRSEWVVPVFAGPCYRAFYVRKA